VVRYVEPIRGLTSKRATSQGERQIWVGTDDARYCPPVVQCRCAHGWNYRQDIYSTPPKAVLWVAGATLGQNYYDPEEEPEFLGVCWVERMDNLRAR
jgi:hypothetical protein